MCGRQTISAMGRDSVCFPADPILRPTAIPAAHGVVDFEWIKQLFRERNYKGTSHRDFCLRAIKMTFGIFLKYEYGARAFPRELRRIIPHFLQTIPLGIYRKERNRNESNRHCPPGGRFRAYRHSQRDPPHAAYSRGRPLADIIDTVRSVLMGNEYLSPALRHRITGGAPVLRSLARNDRHISVIGSFPESPSQSAGWPDHHHRD